MILGSGLPRIEARALLEHVSGRSRSWLIAHGNETAEAEAAAAFAALARRRLAGEPLAYLTGVREFHGLALQVNASVLIPRADTEALVDLAIECAPPEGRLLDLGTGSGAIVIAVGSALPGLRLVATDLSEAALQVAAANGATLLAPDRPGGPPRWLAGSWWEALPPDEPRFDIIVSNPPYIRDDDPHLQQGDLPHEPAAALASGPRGLDAIAEIVAGAPARLEPEGWLLLEHGHDQGAEVRALFATSGWRDIETHPDAEARERVTAARAPRSHDGTRAAMPFRLTPDARRS